MKHRKLLSLGVDATAPVTPPPAAPRANPSGLRGWIANPSPPRPLRTGLTGWIA